MVMPCFVVGKYHLTKKSHKKLLGYHFGRTNTVNNHNIVLNMKYIHPFLIV